MDKEWYSLKETSDILKVEISRIRYYEQHLNISIRRNARGHRIVSKQNIEVMAKLIELMDGQGIELKHIKSIVGNNTCESIADLERIGVLELVKPVEETPTISDIVCSESGTDLKKDAFLNLIKATISESLTSSQEMAKKRIKDEIMAEISEELKKEIRSDIAYYVSSQIEEIKEQATTKNRQDEAYYRKLDETIRDMQRLKKELVELKDESKKSIWSTIFNRKPKQENNQKGISI
ncbi:MAG: hypothetical protein BEN19_03525 [Epulopiscium sp. Nuni2H_MBin003]|nr:MAG: hypothetical protein BEN19_03525 [Epulopiscium sp. Nuni2H_MBin003]